MTYLVQCLFIYLFIFLSIQIQNGTFVFLHFLFSLSIIIVENLCLKVENNTKEANQANTHHPNYRKNKSRHLKLNYGLSTKTKLK